MHTFPSRDTEARKQWIDFVKKDRADWEPTRYSSPWNLVKTKPRNNSSPKYLLNYAFPIESDEKSFYILLEKKLYEKFLGGGESWRMGDKKNNPLTSYMLIIDYQSIEVHIPFLGFGVAVLLALKRCKQTY